jgi:hypothetical protein
MDRNDFRNPERRTGYSGDLEADRLSDVGPPINKKARTGSENRGAKAPNSGSGAVIGSGAGAGGGGGDEDFDPDPVAGGGAVRTKHVDPKPIEGEDAPVGGSR